VSGRRGGGWGRGGLDGSPRPSAIDDESRKRRRKGVAVGRRVAPKVQGWQERQGEGG